MYMLMTGMCVFMALLMEKKGKQEVLYCGIDGAELE